MKPIARQLSLLLSVTAFLAPQISPPLLAQQPPPKPRVVADEEDIPTPPAVPKPKVVAEAPEAAKPAPAAEAGPAPHMIPEAPKAEKKASAGTAAEGAPATEGPDEDLYSYASMLFKRGSELKDQTMAIQSLGLAVESYAKYLATYPNGKRTDAVLTFKGEAHLKRQELPAAMDAWLQVTKNFKTGAYVAYSARQLATLYFKDEKPQEAARLFAIAAEQSTKPEDKSQLRHYQGLAHQKAGNLKEAAAAWEKNVKTTGLGVTLYQDQSLLELGRYELETKAKTARDRFERLTASAGATGPLKAEAYYTLGMLDLEAKKPTEAQANFEACSKVPSVGKWSALARTALIRSYAVAEQPKKVTDAWTKIDINDVPQEARAQLILAAADAYRQQEVYGSAIDLYGMLENFYKDTPEAAEATYRKIVCLYKLKDPNTDKEAYAFIEKMKQKDPNSPFLDMARLMRAEDAFARKKWDLATQCYKEVRPDKIEPKLRASLYYRRGRAAAENGNHAVAIESLGQFIADYPTDPSLPEVSFRRGQSYVELGDLMNAQKDFDAVVERFPTNPIHEDAFHYSAILRGKTKDYDGLINRYKEMLTTYPQSKYKGEANFWIGTGHYFLKQYRECLEPLAYAASVYVDGKEDALQKRIMAFTQLEDLDSLSREIDNFYKGNPKTQVPAEVLAYLGGKRYTEQNYAEAAKYLGKAVTSKAKAPLPPAAWFQLADSRLNTKDNQGTIEASDKYLEVGGNLPADRKCKVHLLRGQAYLNLKKLPEALENANAGLKLHVEGPSQSRLLHLCGDIALADNDPKEAASNYGVVANLGPYDEVAADAIRKLIQIFEKSGEATEVEKYRAKFKAEYPNEPSPP